MEKLIITQMEIRKKQALVTALWRDGKIWNLELAPSADRRLLGSISNAADPLRLSADQIFQKLQHCQLFSQHRLTSLLCFHYKSIVPCFVLKFL